MKNISKPVPIATLSDELLSTIKSSVNLIKTGFANLDKDFGIAAGELILIGGRPSMGKTQFAVNLVSNLYPTYACLYFSLDLSLKKITSRFLAAQTGIEAHKLQGQPVSKPENERITIAQNEFKKADLFLTDTGYQDIDAILVTIKTHVAQYQTKVVVIDDLQALIAAKTKSKINTQTSMLLQEFKQMATSLDLVVVVLSQLSREVEKRPLHIPQLSDFIGGNSALALVDKVWLLYRPEYYAIPTLNDGTPSSDIAQLFITQNNRGAKGEVLFSIDRNFTKFTPFDFSVFKSTG